MPVELVKVEVHLPPLNTVPRVIVPKIIALHQLRVYVLHLSDVGLRVLDAL